MSIKELVGEVKAFFEDVLERPAHVIGVERRGNDWLIKVETVEDSEYMRKRALDDVVGLYEVVANEKMEIVSYKRLGLRQRDEIEEDKEE
ncbi:MAG: hypothetical protein ACYCVD_03480 [Desulfitobacteriaceae bacterium]